MNIKISTFKSRLKHSPEFDGEINRFIADIEAELDTPLSFAELDDYDCDLKLIFVQTGGSEGLFLENFGRLQPPYYLLTNGSNNSLAASLEILTYLNQRGEHGEILHGNAAYIAGRLKKLATVSAAKRRMRGARLGVIGRPSDWLIASVPDYGAVCEKTGITLVDVPLGEVEAFASATLAGGGAASYKDRVFDRVELGKAEAIEKGIAHVVKKYNLNGFTVRCFDLLTSLKSTGCLALAKLNADGVTGTCEGDVAVMLSMFIVKLLTGASSFQANPSQIDVEGNSVVFAHCTAPLDMLEDYVYDTHFESGTGVAIKGNLGLKRVTVVRLSADLKNYYVSSGEIVENLHRDNLCRTQIRVRMDSPVSELLLYPCGNHHAIVYGDYAELIEGFMRDVFFKE